MKTPTILITLIIVAAIGAGIFFFSQQNKKNAVMPQDAMTADTLDNTSSNNTVADSSTAEGRYLIFTPEILTSTADKKRVLFFYANWCPTCRPVDLNLKQNASQIPENIVVIRVNYNDSDTDEDEKKLAQQYGVTYQHTFVQIDSNGKVITTWNGGQLEELLSNTK